MPDDNNQDNQNNQNDSQNNNANNTSGGSTSKQVVLGCDSNGVDDAGCMNTVKSVLEGGGFQVESLGIAPGPFAEYSYSDKAKGKNGVYLMAASLVSFVDAANANFDFNVMGIRGDVTSFGTEEGFKSKGVPKDHHGDCIAPECDKYAGKTYPELNQIYQGKVQAVPGETPQKLGENILAALNGSGVSSSGGGSSGGGAQIKDKTFEKCLRRLCAATDSIFIVESNAAVLFPYVDWMAFTLRQKINTIKSNEIDPNVFTMEYGNEGFYNKVTIAWGGATLPERFPKNEDGTPKDVKRVTNYTAEDILKNMQLTNFNYETFQEQQDLIRKQKEETKKAKEEKKNKTSSVGAKPEDIVTKKGDTTQTLSVDDKGVTLLSEQYDALVDKYGEQEKRLESEAPDYETAQYIINALLIQYVRDYNNMCKCRALSDRKYIGGTFYSVENPFTKESELFYLNGYTIRIQKDEPMYHDLDFRYGPEGAEEILDYQTLSGGAAAGGGEGTTGGSATEQEVWERAKVPCHFWSCPELRVGESDTEDPKTAEDYYNKMAPTGKKFCLTCYGMSAFLYYEFNYKAGIKCQVVGNSGHHVVMIDRGDGKGFVETREEYRQLDQGFRWSDQGTGVLLAAPSGGSSQSGGNTNLSNNNSGNRS